SPTRSTAGCSGLPTRYSCSLRATSRCPRRSARDCSRRASSTKAEPPLLAGFAPAIDLASMQVGLIGAGNMARAMARGWGEPVLCSDGGSGRAKQLARELGGKALRSNRAVADRSDLIVLCHKPAQFLSIARELRGHARAVASVLAGVDSQALR